MIEPIDARVSIGHVHLKVADLDRALAFYRDVLGFQLTQRMGSQAAFLSAGGYHHHLGLNTWESLGGAPPPPAARVCTTWQSGTRTGGASPTRIAASSALAFASMVRPTTGSAKLSTFGIRRQRSGALLGPSSRAVASQVGGDLAMYTAPLDLAGLRAELK